MGKIRPNNSELCLIIPICSELLRVILSRDDWTTFELLYQRPMRNSACYCITQPITTKERTTRYKST